MRERFEKQMQKLNNQLMTMGSTAEQAIRSAITALQKQDASAAENARRLEEELDGQERDIETLCLKLILEQQPVAGDLRQISSALRMITDLERIGDQAADIAELAMRLYGQTFIKPITHLPQMAQQAMKMVTGSIDAFITHDLATAEAVWDMDTTVDNFFDTIKNELIALIRKDASNGEQAVDLLMIAKYLERIGDHAQNLSEWVIYSLTGTHKGGETQ
ncbi:MAG: phosphate signaling complex protein PhoU [Pyramidobacter sp.]|jgi:phosphate transport system protein